MKNRILMVILLVAVVILGGLTIRSIRNVSDYRSAKTQLAELISKLEKAEKAMPVMPLSAVVRTQRLVLTDATAKDIVELTATRKGSDNFLVVRSGVLGDIKLRFGNDGSLGVILAKGAEERAVLSISGQGNGGLRLSGHGTVDLLTQDAPTVSVSQRKSCGRLSPEMFELYNLELGTVTALLREGKDGGPAIRFSTPGGTTTTIPK